jgi:hypothetical protein
MSRDVNPSLIDVWRTRAVSLANWGAPEASRLWALAADELEAFERERGLAALSLAEASAESGYSEAHLSRLVHEGRIANAGRDRAPRIRRKDLPRKPRGDAAVHSTDLVGNVLGLSVES